MHLYNFMPQAPTHPLFLDGDDEQEDELQDVEDGKLEPPADDETSAGIKGGWNRVRNIQDDDAQRSVASQDDEDELRRERANFPKA